MMPRRATRKLTAILSADVVGYSWLVAQDEQDALSRFSGHVAEIFVPLVKSHDGRVIKTMGDGLLVEFNSVVEALNCALEVQRSMAERNAELSGDRRMDFRIGINTGDVVSDAGDILGEGVNIAARLQTLAEPGGICISARVHDDVTGRVRARFEDMGPQHLKNMDRPVNAFRVSSGAPVATARPLPIPEKPSIAVLPFANMSGDPEQEYFADAIAEDLVTAMSRWHSFFVIARNSSFIYKGKAVDVRRVGRELGIRYVTEGSVRRVGNRVRVTVQLLDAVTGTHLWAEKFDRDLVDILDLQDEITRQVAQAIEPALLQSENVRLGRKSLTDYTAYDCYQRGMWHLNKVSAEGYREAVALFREAIARDPQMSLGYVGLARILYGGATVYGWSEHPVDDLQGSFEAAKRAIELDSSDAYAQFAYAGAALYLAKHSAALDAARRAVSLNPNFAYGHNRLGQVLIYCGQPADAIKPIEKALRHSPFDPQTGSMIASLALAHYQSKNYTEAVSKARIAIEHNFELGYAVLAAALARLGRMEEARNALSTDVMRLLGPTSTVVSYANAADRDHILVGLQLAAKGVSDTGSAG